METSTRFETVTTSDENKLIKIHVQADYDSNRPYEVQFVFCDYGKPPSAVSPVWVFSRELLQEGLHTSIEKPAGTGDVQCGMLGIDFIVRLNSPFGNAEFALPWREVAIFVNAMYVMVPEGKENVPFDPDAELKALLEGK